MIPQSEAIREFRRQFPVLGNILSGRAWIETSRRELDVYKRQEVEPVRTGSGAATYNHLPNPLADIIRQLPVVDGLEADKLLPFFKIVFELKDYPGMLERTVLELNFLPHKQLRIY